MSLKKGDLSKQLTVPQWALKEDSGGEAMREKVIIHEYIEVIVFLVDGFCDCFKYTHCKM